MYVVSLPTQRGEIWERYKKFRPEQGLFEIWGCNIPRYSVVEGIQDYRVGMKAYDDLGNFIPNYRPVFAPILGFALSGIKEVRVWFDHEAPAIRLHSGLNKNLLALFLQHAQGNTATASQLIEWSLIDGLLRLGMPESELIKAGVTRRTMNLIKKYKADWSNPSEYGRFSKIRQT